MKAPQEQRLVSSFVLGFLFGFFLISIYDFDRKTLFFIKNIHYDEKVARILHDEVKILCFVSTFTENHRTKAAYIRETWGKRCKKLIFVTNSYDPLLYSSVVLNVSSSEESLRIKTRSTFLLAEEEYSEDYDWFLKTDDDTFVIMENLLYLLHQYKPTTAFFLGDRLILPPDFNQSEGYMAGSAYILSKKAVSKFAKIVKELPKTDLFFKSGKHEDANVGRVLSHEAIFADTRDEFNQKRFFPVSILSHLKVGKKKKKTWYDKYLYYNVSHGSIDCCSDVPISFNYIDNSTQFLLEYFVYNIHPFGLKKKSRHELPIKLTLNEIIEASDAESFAENYRKHDSHHEMEESELY